MLQDDINNWFRIKQGTTKFALEEQISSSDDGLFICAVFYSEADYGHEGIPSHLGIEQPGFEPQPLQPHDGGRPNWAKQQTNNSKQEQSR